MSQDIETVQRELEREKIHRKVAERRIQVLTGVNTILGNDKQVLHDTLMELGEEVAKVKEELASKQTTIDLLNASVKENYKERNRLKQVIAEDILPQGILEPVGAYEMDELTFTISYILDAFHYDNPELYAEMMRAFIKYGREAEERINARRLENRSKVLAPKGDDDDDQQ